MGFKKTIRKITEKKSRKKRFDLSSTENKDSAPIFTELEKNIQKIEEETGKSTDVVIRRFNTGENGEIQCCIVYVEGLVDKDIPKDIVQTLLIDTRTSTLIHQLSATNDKIEFIYQFILEVAEAQIVEEYNTLYTSIMSGDTILLVHGMTKGIICSTRGWENRGVQEPEAQTVIRGPREGFTESLRTNTSLIRRKIKSEKLWLETKEIGRVTKTSIAIMYIKGIVNDKIVEEVHQRLDKIDIDGILESGYIEELIQDETYTPFPTMYNTERPDSVAANLLEGRIAILVDGTPFVLIVPALFMQFFQASEDYYQRFDISTIIRLLRFLTFFIALLAPAFYVAILTFHQEMLPTELLIGVVANREGVPFPAFIEALLMEITFEILREAGVRMPRAVGQAISIVGALVLGQAAVEAGLVSPAMVIIVSITAISNFVFPSFNMAIAIRMIRFLMMGLAAAFGLFGITIGIIAMVLHLCSLRSFGIPFMSPMAPFIMDDQKDSILRVPIWGMFARPRLLSQFNNKREANSSPGKPPNRSNESGGNE
ncbi:spore germination protein [Caldalkalibacillus mannanilyticus]|uniref:spore germination protein n=1 Tax=Caldalkalibacillus mannanilyticus TaxID=1418 RepID=UPI000469C21A|nr:spore germination protein [Caldalkalibacillus mannanilyticus]